MIHDKDTSIVTVTSDARFFYVMMSVAGNPLPYKLPRETLSIRAAEYNLDIEHDDPLDMIMREIWIPDVRPEVSVAGHPHPLYHAESVDTALAEVNGHIEEVRVDRKAPPEETGNRLLAGAVRNRECTKGLVKTRDAFLLAHDPRITEPVQYFRDAQRAFIAESPEEPTYVDSLLREMDKAKARAIEMSKRDGLVPLPSKID